MLVFLTIKTNSDKLTGWWPSDSLEEAKMSLNSVCLKVECGLRLGVGINMDQRLISIQNFIISVHLQGGVEYWYQYFHTDTDTGVEFHSGTDTKSKPDDTYQFSLKPDVIRIMKSRFD